MTARDVWEHRALRALAVCNAGEVPCGRCSGTGYYAHYGRCFRCGGSGVDPEPPRTPRIRGRRIAQVREWALSMSTTVPS